MEGGAVMAEREHRAAVQHKGEVRLRRAQACSKARFINTSCLSPSPVDLASELHYQVARSRPIFTFQTAGIAVQ